MMLGGVVTEHRRVVQSAWRAGMQIFISIFMPLSLREDKQRECLAELMAELLYLIVKLPQSPKVPHITALYCCTRCNKLWLFIV